MALVPFVSLLSIVGNLQVHSTSLNHCSAVSAYLVNKLCSTGIAGGRTFQRWIITFIDNGTTSGLCAIQAVTDIPLADIIRKTGTAPAYFVVFPAAFEKVSSPYVCWTQLAVA